MMLLRKFIRDPTFNKVSSYASVGCVLYLQEKATSKRNLNEDN